MSSEGAPDPDTVLASYREAIQALAEERFDVDIPIGGDGELESLGHALRGLAAALGREAGLNATLSRISVKINEGLVLEDVLELVYDSFRMLIPYDRIGLAFLEQQRTEVRAHWARSEASEIRLGAGYSHPLTGSSLEDVMHNGRPRIINDLEAYLAAHPGSQSTRLIVAEGMRSSLTCPLMVKNEPVGFLFFSSRELGTYRESHQQIFMRIAGQLAVILDKSRLYRELLRLNHRLQATMEALEKMATRDSLTGLWNRRSILDLLQREIARCQRERRALAALILDIDHFKAINDRIGHLAGDEVLREITRRVGAALRSADFFGRLGGEEFLIIVSPGDRSTAFEVMERARLACAETPIHVEGEALTVTVSLGAAVAPCDHVSDPTEMLGAADRALYRAKDGGRNRCEIEVLE